MNIYGKLMTFGNIHRIDCGVRHGFIMSPCLFNVYMDGVMKEVRESSKLEESRFGKVVY